MIGRERERDVALSAMRGSCFFPLSPPLLSVFLSFLFFWLCVFIMFVVQKSVGLDSGEVTERVRAFVFVHGCLAWSLMLSVVICFGAALVSICVCVFCQSP